MLNHNCNPQSENKKAKKLARFASLALNLPEHRQINQLLLTELDLDPKQIIDEYVKYGLDVNDVHNSIYESIENRFVLYLQNLLPDSWNQDRQRAVISMLNKITFKSIADIGFGVPGLYIKDILEQKTQATVTLFDLYDSAFKFAKHLLHQWSQNWESFVSLKKTDMNNLDFVGNYDVYIFLDSIEHINHPNEYLELYINESSKSAKFIISIPIGPLIPVHTIAWESVKDGMEWILSKGLKISSASIAHVNPLTDLFAEQSGFNFRDLIVLCHK